MKIGILTFHLPSNFGANLQAYSSIRIYETLGHQALIINYQREADRQYSNKVNAKQFKEHLRFVDDYLPHTRLVTSQEELVQLVKEEAFDLISIGADAVWRAPKDEKDLIYFADWLFISELHIPVVSMSAAHMGNGFNHLPISLRNRIKTDLEQFKFISVRDTWTRDKINKDIFNDRFINIINPDPVIWLSDFANNEELSQRQELSSRPYYLMSLPVRCEYNSVMQKWFSEFKHLVNDAGYSLVELPLPEGISGLDFDYTVPYPINPLQWFKIIGNAKAFCGLRFHAIISSISSGTPFYSIDSYGSSSLGISIARRIGLYRIARSFDKCSKIRNLLQGSSFEKHRVSGSITQVRPKVVFNLLESTRRSEVISFRDRLRQQYSMNIDKMFKSIGV